MEVSKDIESFDDIQKLVDSFYDKVRKDELIGPIFNARIQDRWDQHLEKMYRFWQTVLLGAHTYFGSPFPPHADLPLAHDHFEKWMELFTQTLDELFSGEKTKEAKWRAEKMAEMFLSKIEYYKDKSYTGLV